MTSPQVVGYDLLRKQREQRLKRLSGLSLSDYYRAMEDIRNGKPLNPNVKRYILHAYN